MRPARAQDGEALAVSLISSVIQHEVKFDLMLIGAGQITSNQPTLAQTTSAIPKSACGWPDILPALPLFAQLRTHTLMVAASTESTASVDVFMKTCTPANSEAADQSDKTEWRPKMSNETFTVDAPVALMVDAKVAAKLCGIGKTTWYQLHAAGRTPLPVRFGRRALWRRDEIADWIAAGCPARHQWQVRKEGRGESR